MKATEWNNSVYLSL